MTEDHDHSHGHDHDHDHGTDDETADDPRPRIRAIQSLLVEKGIVSTDAVDEAISAYEHEIGPLNGARVVARAWTDPEFERALLSDATAAIEASDLEFDVGLDHLAVKENTADGHNVVVCTLCSCYPWSMLGLPPTWYKTPAYRSRMVREPRAVLSEFGLDLDDGTDVDVWDSSSELRYMVLPRRPPGTEDYDESELAELVTRDAMVGVERLDAAPAADGGPRPSAAPARATEPPAVDLPDGLAALGGGGSTPDSGPAFRAPWQARAFGVAVALRDAGPGIDWSAFQERLIDAVEAAGGLDPDDPARSDEAGALADALDDGRDGAAERAYYEQWLDALERLVVDRGLLDAAAVDARAGEFAGGDRTAEEFVAGERAH